jgi:hypothetical protein
MHKMTGNNYGHAMQGGPAEKLPGVNLCLWDDRPAGRPIRSILGGFAFENKQEICLYLYYYKLKRELHIQTHVTQCILAHEGFDYLMNMQIILSIVFLFSVTTFVFCYMYQVK